MAKKRKIPKFLFDALLIVISVLFALFINEWRSNINKNNETEVILNNIELELKNNLESAKRLRKYHKKIRDNIYKAYESDSLESTFFDEQVFSIYKVAPNGLLQEDFGNIAWEVARQENISSRIDFKTSRLLFKAYDQQESVLSTLSELLSLFDERETQRIEHLEESVTIFGRHLMEAVGQEQNMIIYYERALKQLSKDH